MKKYFVTVLTVLLTYSNNVLAQEATTTGKGTSSDIQGALLGIALLWMIGHMVYELFIRKKPLASISIDEMKAQRRESGMSEEMTEQEKEEVVRIHDEDFYKWTPLPDDAEERRVITNKKMYDNAIAAMQQVVALKPTDPELVDALNANVDVIRRVASDNSPAPRSSCSY